MLGTSSERTIVASTRIATASPSPKCCRPTIRPATKPEERGAHDHRRRGDDPAGALEPVGDGGRVVGAVVPRLAHARDEEHLVVHREAEEHREQEDRDPALDLAEVVEPEACLADAPLEDDDEHPVGSADREQVQRTAFSGSSSERNARTSSTYAQTSTRRSAAGRTCTSRCEEVDALRGRAAGADLTPGREPGGRNEVVAQPVDEGLRLREAVVVRAGDDHLPVVARRST